MKSSSSGMLEELLAARLGGQAAQALLISVDAGQEADVRRQLVRAFLCEKDGAPDCMCRSCTTAADSHPDFIELVPEPRTISRDAVRQAVLTLAVGPLWSSSKLICVNPADRLGREAESYLLKHLEEPPVYAQYLLLTRSPDAIIPTIRSRCQHWRLGRTGSSEAPDHDITAALKGEPLTPERAIEAAYWAKDQYRRTGRAEWLAAWDTLQLVCQQLEANGNEELARARILRVWPLARW